MESIEMQRVLNRRHHDMSPEQRLIAEIFMLALLDATRFSENERAAEESDKYQRAQTVINRRIEAKRWLFEDSDAPGSAAWCAEALGLDIRRLRAALRSNLRGIGSGLHRRRAMAKAA